VAKIRGIGPISGHFRHKPPYPANLRKPESRFCREESGLCGFSGRHYLLDQDEEEDARGRALVGLLRSGLLKRFESSAFAFRRTVDKMVREHGVFSMRLMPATL